MAWGVMMTDQYNNPWVTPDSTPMCLVQKIVTNPTGDYKIPINVSSAAPFIVACHSNKAAVSFYLSRDEVSGYHITCAASDGAGEVTIYIFGYVIPQPVPKWGVAIWNAQGQCILTNETKVMPAPLGLGTIGNNADIGYNVNRVLSGKYAVIPKSVGLLVGTIQSGSVIRPFTSSIDTTAYFNGSTTQISSRLRISPDGAVQNQGYSNSMDLIYVIDVSKF